MDKKDIKLVIVTGLSGAGKTQAIRIFEDLGYYCVDNLPSTLIPKFTELIGESGGKIKKAALVIDVRGGDFFDSLFSSLASLEEEGYEYEILFLEASDEVLVKRFKEVRRQHPLSREGRVLDGIAAERKMLEGLRGKADKIIDTSQLNSRQLKEEISALFGGENHLEPMLITVLSFGYKYGIPLDSDLVFDVRFLPNPHYVESLRVYTGEDPRVRDYVLKWPATQKFLAKLLAFLDFCLPHYVKEGKSQLTISIGCTGGRHRSVTIANYLYDYLRQHGYRAAAVHRDAEKGGGE